MAVLVGMPSEGPLVHLAGRPDHDDRWQGLPMAVFLKSGSYIASRCGLITGMFDKQSTPYNSAADVCSIGPAAECLDIASAVKRGVIARTAYRVVRARRRHEGVVSPGAAERLVGAAVVGACAPPPFSSHPLVSAVVPLRGHRPPSRATSPERGGARMRPPQATDE